MFIGYVSPYICATIFLSTATAVGNHPEVQALSSQASFLSKCALWQLPRAVAGGVIHVPTVCMAPSSACLCFSWDKCAFGATRLHDAVTPKPEETCIWLLSATSFPVCPSTSQLAPLTLKPFLWTTAGLLTTSLYPQPRIPLAPHPAVLLGPVVSAHPSQQGGSESALAPRGPTAVISLIEIFIRKYEAAAKEIKREAF